ncbi:hypothetical protein NQ117_23115 [Paenibacillus sp. SC116]|uniref:hypothetical protein n=1 Tax=Paenibacillus sp. SC116 TaxID=2968986 RepID=UPI00215B0236|nr:hypothetical protein [Paenibacillus sp. SC116]MCR8846581.1 hypothetical protein [Paenibacillus sp. SC116]
MKKSTSAAAWSFSMMMLLAPTISAQAVPFTPSVIQMAEVQKRVDTPDKRLLTREKSNLFHEKHVESERNTSEK